MLHLVFDAVKDHAAVAVAATVNGLIGAFLGFAGIIGAEVNDGLLTAFLMFVLVTGSGIAGWGLVLLVKLTSVVARLEGDRDDHERRLLEIEARRRSDDR